jgi:hypothetical protein
VPVSSSSSCELCPTFWTRELARDSTFLALVSKEVAEGGKLSTVASMTPTLRLWPGVDESHRVPRLLCCDWRASDKIWFIVC